MGICANPMFSIRLLEPYDSIDGLTGLLHRAYKELADMGFQYVATYQTPDVTRVRIQDVECYVAVAVGLSGDQAIRDTDSSPPNTQHLTPDTHSLLGTIAFHDASRTGGSAWYDLPDVASFHQFAVDPSCQRMGLGSALLDKVEQRARETGAREIALDTAEGAHHLIALYERRGYRYIEHVQWDVTNYRSVIMSKKF